MHRELGITRELEKVPERREIVVGNRVRVPSFDSEGIVAEDFGNSMLVTLGSHKTVVSKAEAEGLGPANPMCEKTSLASYNNAIVLETLADTQMEVDVRGKRYVEVEPLVELWLDEARLVGASPLRLIHRKGTGALG